jgi:hypothetical protein
VGTTNERGTEKSERKPLFLAPLLFHWHWMSFVHAAMMVDDGLHFCVCVAIIATATKQTLSVAVYLCGIYNPVLLLERLVLILVNNDANERRTGGQGQKQ